MGGVLPQRLEMAMIIILRIALQGQGQLSSALAAETGKDPRLAWCLLPPYPGWIMTVQVVVAQALWTFRLLRQACTEPARLFQCHPPLTIVVAGTT
jgi:hypothetical protein